ncbi:MAG: hypothetical protein SynsKO_24080 [Synoicihabitans sp.]
MQDRVGDLDLDQLTVEIENEVFVARCHHKSLRIEAGIVYPSWHVTADAADVQVELRRVELGDEERLEADQSHVLSFQIQRREPRVGDRVGLGIVGLKDRGGEIDVLSVEPDGVALVAVTEIGSIHAHEEVDVAAADGEAPESHILEIALPRTDVGGHAIDETDGQRTADVDVAAKRDLRLPQGHPDQRGTVVEVQRFRADR